MRGRRAAGPEVVQRAEGEASGKDRAEIVLKTITGELSVNEASDLLKRPRRLT
jgi:hypothetical protein